MTPALPQRMYLLCFDTGKGRLETSSALVQGQLLRAAAVADLAIGGLLRDRDGKAERTPPTAATPGDAFRTGVRDEVPAEGTRRWFDVVNHDWHLAEALVRDQLVADGEASVARRRVLGLFPVHRVTLTDPGQPAALRERVRDTVLGGHDPAAAAIEDASLAAFAADGDVHIVFTARERIAHRHAFRALAEHVDDALPGIRKALLLSVAARRGSATA